MRKITCLTAIFTLTNAPLILSSKTRNSMKLVNLYNRNYVQPLVNVCKIIIKNKKSKTINKYYVLRVFFNLLLMFLINLFSLAIKGLHVQKEPASRSVLNG